MGTPSRWKMARYRVTERAREDEESAADVVVSEPSNWFAAARFECLDQFFLNLNGRFWRKQHCFETVTFRQHWLMWLTTP